MLQAALDQGRGTRVFADMVSALGGPADLVERVDDYLPSAPVVRPVFLDGEGYIATIDVRRVGNAIVALGGGRKRVEDRIDHSVGLTDIAGIGARIDPHTPTAHVHARDEAGAEAASESLRRAFMLTEEQPELKPVICKTIDPVPSS